LNSKKLDFPSSTELELKHAEVTGNAADVEEVTKPCPVW